MNSDKASASIPYINLDLDGILLKADSGGEVLTYPSSLSGIAYAVGADGGILMLGRHQFFGERVDDMRVIHEELGYIIEEAERWQRQNKVTGRGSGTR